MTNISRLLVKYFIFSIGVVLIICISGTLKINQDIANKSQGYFVQRNIEQANEAGRLGYIKYEVNDYAKTFGLNWEWKPGMDRMRIIRSGPDDFDDIGYISLLELIAIGRKTFFGKEIHTSSVEKIHNFSFIIAAAILSFMVVKFFENIFAGWLFLILTLMLKAKILSLVYGSPDSRTFVIFFPFIVMSIIFGLNWLSIYLNKLWGWAVVLLFGILIGTMMLIRSSEGMAVLYTILFCIALLRATLKQKVMTVVTIMVGYFSITLVMPIIFAVHRDIKTAEFNGNISMYLHTAKRHPAWHSIVAGIGRYPNSIDMKYDDKQVYKILRSRYPDAMDPGYDFHGEDYFPGLRGIYFNYVTQYPLEYLKNIVQAYVELFYFLPYSVSVGSRSWNYGFLPIKPGVKVDDWDLPLGQDSLINLRYRYLNLTIIEWMVFIIAIIVIILVVRSSLIGIAERDNQNIFLPFSLYISLLATQRAIIPQHGLSLLVGFWMFAILSLLYMCFVNNRIRSFLYWRVKKFNI